MNLFSKICFSLLGIALMTKGAFASPLTDLAGGVASGAVSEASGVMASPVGYVIYFVIGLAVVGIVVATVKGFMKKG